MTTQRMIRELHYQVNVSSTENITSYAINKGTLYFWEEEIITGDKRDLLLFLALHVRSIISWCGALSAGAVVTVL